MTCDTIPYSDAKCSDMRYACHLPVSVCDADLTEREGYERDVTDHLKKDIVFNDAEDRSGQYIEQSAAPLQDVTSISSSRHDCEGRANHGGRGSAGCAYRSGPASHDADLERILRYAGETPRVGAGTDIEYMGGIRDNSQKPDEMVRPLTPESVLLSNRSPAHSSLSIRAVERVWYPDHFHDDGLNGALRTERQSDKVISTERYLNIHSRVLIHRYAHIHVHVQYMHTYIHIYMHICRHAYMHTYMHSYVYIYMHTYMYTYIHTHIHTYVHIYIHTNIHTYMHTYIHTHIHTYLHTYMNTYMHIQQTYVNTYMHLLADIHEHIYAYTCRHIQMHTCIRTCMHICDRKITPSPYHLTGVELIES